MEEYLLEVGCHTGAEEKNEEEGAAETKCDELTAISIPSPLALLRGRKQSKSEVKLNLGGRERWTEVGRRCFQVWIYFSLSCSNLIGNKLISPS